MRQHGSPAPSTLVADARTSAYQERRRLATLDARHNWRLTHTSSEIQASDPVRSRL